MLMLGGCLSLLFNFIFENVFMLDGGFKWDVVDCDVGFVDVGVLFVVDGVIVFVDSGVLNLVYDVGVFGMDCWFVVSSGVVFLGLLS